MNTRKLLLLCLLILCWSISACERSNGLADPSTSPSTLKPTQEARTGMPNPSETPWNGGLLSPSAGKHSDIQTKPSQALSNIASISTGRIFDAAGYGWKPGISYAFAKDGSAWFWGFATYDISISAPQLIKGLDHIQEISGSYALTTDGQLWFLNEDKIATMVNGMNDIKAIQHLNAMSGTLFVLKQNGTVWQLKDEKSNPEQLLNFENISRIYGSDFSLFILNENGKLFYWDGRNGEGPIKVIFSIEHPDKVAQIAVGFDDIALIQTDKGEMYTFSPEEMKLNRTPLVDHAKAMSVSGRGTFLFVKLDGSVWGWGENINGILGDNRSDMVEEPVNIEGLTDIVNIQTGTDHALALDGKGYVFSWGSNMTGQLGRMPVIFDQWQEVGELDGIQQVVTQFERPYFVRRDGSIWKLHEDGLTYEVIKGTSNIRKLTEVYGIAITLNAGGEVHIWSDKFTSSQKLPLPFQVKNLIGGEGRLLLQSINNRLEIIEFKAEIEKQGESNHVRTITPEKTEVIQSNAEWVSRVKSLHSNHYTFLALTDDGRVYYATKPKDTDYVFKLVSELPRIKELAAEYFIYYTHEPASVWALDENGSVHEVVVKLLNPALNRINEVVVSVSPDKENGIAAISGRLRITKDNYIFEHDWSPLRKQLIPNPISLITSRYGYAIEGPGSHYHLLVTNSNKLAIIGYNPFGIRSSTPKKVVVP